MYQTVGRIRIEDLFDIVKLYPDSLPAVRDLEQCLQQCSLQRTLVRVYCRSCASRLQIPGADAFVSDDSSNQPGIAWIKCNSSSSSSSARAQVMVIFQDLVVGKKELEAFVVVLT